MSRLQMRYLGHGVIMWGFPLRHQSRKCIFIRHVINTVECFNKVPVSMATLPCPLITSVICKVTPATTVSTFVPAAAFASSWNRLIRYKYPPLVVLVVAMDCWVKFCSSVSSFPSILASGWVGNWLSWLDISSLKPPLAESWPSSKPMLLPSLPCDSTKEVCFSHLGSTCLMLNLNSSVHISCWHRKRKETWLLQDSKLLAGIALVGHVNFTLKEVGCLSLQWLSLGSSRNPYSTLSTVHVPICQDGEAHQPQHCCPTHFSGVIELMLLILTEEAVLGGIIGWSLVNLLLVVKFCLRNVRWSS